MRGEPEDEERFVFRLRPARVFAGLNPSHFAEHSAGPPPLHPRTIGKDQHQICGRIHSGRELARLCHLNRARRSDLTT